MAPKAISMTVYFDKYDPNSEKATDTRPSLAGLDYSPLPLVTWRSFCMGVLVSMGGLM
jgi:SP family sugar:H+ symporter-like MFS transporter